METGDCVPFLSHLRDQGSHILASLLPRRILSHSGIKQAYSCPDPLKDRVQSICRSGNCQRVSNAQTDEDTVYPKWGYTIHCIFKYIPLAHILALLKLNSQIHIFCTPGEPPKHVQAFPLSMGDPRTRVNINGLAQLLKESNIVPSNPEGERHSISEVPLLKKPCL